MRLADRIADIVNDMQHLADILIVFDQNVSFILSRQVNVDSRKRPKECLQEVGVLEIHERKAIQKNRVGGIRRGGLTAKRDLGDRSSAWPNLRPPHRGR